MSIFVDTSALYAILDGDDDNHESAKRSWIDLITQNAHLVCTNYVLVETFALVQHRLGIDAVRTLQEDILPVLHVEWVDELSHHLGVASMLTAARRNLSLVDCVSFEVIRRLGIKKAFAFDAHYIEQGFECVPR